jgi:tetratricopeptide (TPR) repeat protein
MALVLALSAACGEPAHPTQPSLETLRKGAASRDSRARAEWLLRETLEPGGDARQARRARSQLDTERGAGMYQDLARALDDALHGRLAHAAENYLRAARAARTSRDPNAGLIARFSIEQAAALRDNAEGLWPRWQGWVESSLEAPGQLGWRARDALLVWWADEAWAAAASDVDAAMAKRLGCLSGVRLAGPFGNGDPSEVLRSYPPEELEPWPVAWPVDPMFGNAPSVLEVEQEGCHVRPVEGVADGVFYAEVEFELAGRELAIIAVNSPTAKLWVDGVPVLDRSPGQWGSWTNVGSGLELEAGRHRVLARLTGPEAVVRLLRPDGTPLPVLQRRGSGPSLVAGARVAFEANDLRRHVSGQGVKVAPSPVLKYITAQLAQADGESEAATLLMEPLIRDLDKATGPALALAAELAESDPIYGSNQVEDLVRQLHERALERDAKLWASQLSRVAHIAKSRGLAEAVTPLRELTRSYPQVPDLLDSLSKVYNELGWMPQYKAAVKLRAERFPEHVEGLEEAATVYEEEGDRERAERLYAAAAALQPDSESAANRAVERRDYTKALAELSRLHARRPERKDIEQRILELRAKAEVRPDPLPLLRKAVDESPKDGQTHLQLADALYAAGDREALSKGLVNAIELGADTGPLKNALDLVSAVTELDPFRLNTEQVIREYEAKAEHLPGTAARVLDYMAVWIRSDGSSRMLEHEIIRIQSEEAKTRFAEQQTRGGVVLKLRVLKQDGRILEPEMVEGKPTVTLPHLEIGDYVETEEMFGTGPSPQGVAYDGPQWFFREQDVAYARSELVVISPTDRPLDIELSGQVPAPSVTQDGPSTIRRYRVDKSPAAPDEPFSVPPQEFLPSVKVSWGMGLARHLATLSSRARDMTPIDPRIVKIAGAITQEVKADDELGRARALYRWVLDNVQPGEEMDGRRVVIGKQGNLYRAFVTLCRASRVSVQWVVAKNRLAPAPRGPTSEAEQYGASVLRVGTRETAWVVLVDKYLPFGYLPPEVRGTQGFALGADEPTKVMLPAGGERDRVEFHGTVLLEPSGGAELTLEQVFAGKFGARMRQGLSELGERRTRDAIESQILGPNLRGARLQRYELLALEKTDEPLRLRMHAQMANFAYRRGEGQLQLEPPYTLRLSQFTALSSRQTPILLPVEHNRRVLLKVQLPKGAKVELPAPADLQFGEHRVLIRDRLEGGSLILDREIVLGAGRISVEDYPQFVQFTRRADAALTREIPIRL